MPKRDEVLFEEGTVKGFWEFHNSDCWKISLCHMVDKYLYLPTMRYIYSTAFGEWRGTKNPYPLILQTPEEQGMLIHFDTELDALKWLVEEMDEDNRTMSDEMTAGGDSLSKIISHYDAISILIDSAKKNGDHDALRRWDKARNIKRNYVLEDVGSE